MGLIGRDLFAIDGVKLPCNASKERSGTHEEFKYRAKRLDKAAAKIIVAADVTGSGSEQGMLLPMIEATQQVRAPNTLITTDAGYHSDANLKALAERQIEALIADHQMRERDTRFAEQSRY